MTAFYKFDSKEQFEGLVRNSASEFSHDGVSVSVVGLIPTGTESPNEDGEMIPNYLAGWHVNTSAPIEAWESYKVTPINPMRVFG